MGMMGEGLTVSDAMALTRNDEFGGNGSNSWMLFLFFILACNGRNGFFGGGDSYGGESLTRAELCEGFNFNRVENDLSAVERTLYDQNSNMLRGLNSVQSDLCVGFNGVNAGIADLGYKTQACCCETNRNIDAVRYENAKNTCDIIQAGNLNTQRIIDTMTQNEIQNLRDELQTSKLIINNTNQTQDLICSLRPYPQPAYITCSPYMASTAAYSGCGGCSGGY